MSPRASSSQTPRRSVKSSASSPKKSVARVKASTPKHRSPARKTTSKKLSSVFVQEKKIVQKARSSVQATKKSAPIAKPASPSRFRSILRTIGLQCIIAGSAAVILILMGMIERDVFTTKSGHASGVVTPATIGLEFDGRLALSFVVAEKDDRGYINVTNASAKDVFIALPSEWSRLEVVGASLEETQGELPLFGFTRYKLPKFASLRFAVPELPSDLLFDARGTGVAAIQLKTIHLDPLQTTSQTVLVQKQTLVRLGADGN